jgi:hypothetical protein
MKRWTHTATLAAVYPVGAEQFGNTVPLGSTVTLYKDPAEQEGDLITFRFGSGTGVARLSDLRNVKEN